LSLSFRVSNRNPSCLSHASHISHPSHPSQLDQPITFGEQYKSWNSPLCSFLHPHVTSYLSGSNIFLRTLISNTNARKNSFAALFSDAQCSKSSSTLGIQYMKSGEIKYSESKICTWKKWRPASEWTRIEFIFALGSNGNPDVSGRKKWEACDF
jgi:hypothetical protein